jgi:hypothetical protein
MDYLAMNHQLRILNAHTWFMKFAKQRNIQAKYPSTITYEIQSKPDAHILCMPKK